MNGNRTYILLIVAITAIILITMVVFGAENTFKFWNIPTQQPAFADLRILPGGAESFRQGFDPIKENPADPFKRYFNYPGAWYIFFYTGIDQSDIFWMAAILLVMFFSALLLFPGDIQLSDALVLISVVFSPAVMLAVERGNLDLFVFFLCALALVLADYSTLAAVIALTIASFFKLFPFFGVSMFLSEKRSSFFKILALTLGTLIIYAILTYRNMIAAFSYTEKGSDLSYGVNVIPLHIQNLSSNPQVFSILSSISYLILLALFVLALVAGTSQNTNLVVTPSRNLSAFQMGASIYIGTFFLGNNWDYRLIFLLFTIPQLITWAHEQNPWQRFARWALCTVFLSAWYLVLVRLWGFLPLPYVKELAFALDELANWALFGLLTLFMIASAPAWLQAEFRSSFSRRFAQINGNTPKTPG
jgi:hypothetical protein